MRIPILNLALISMILFGYLSAQPTAPNMSWNTPSQFKTLVLSKRDSFEIPLSYLISIPSHYFYDRLKLSALAQGDSSIEIASPLVEKLRDTTQLKTFLALLKIIKCEQFTHVYDSSLSIGSEYSMLCKDSDGNLLAVSFLVESQPTLETRPVFSQFKSIFLVKKTEYDLVCFDYKSTFPKMMHAVCDDQNSKSTIVLTFSMTDTTPSKYVDEYIDERSGSGSLRMDVSHIQSKDGQDGFYAYFIYRRKSDSPASTLANELLILTRGDSSATKKDFMMRNMIKFQDLPILGKKDSNGNYEYKYIAIRSIFLTEAFVMGISLSKHTSDEISWSSSTEAHVIAIQAKDALLVEFNAELSSEWLKVQLSSTIKDSFQNFALIAGPTSVKIGTGKMIYKLSNQCNLGFASTDVRRTSCKTKEKSLINESINLTIKITMLTSDEPTLNIKSIACSKPETIDRIELSPLWNEYSDYSHDVFVYQTLISNEPRAQTLLVISNESDSFKGFELPKSLENVPIPYPSTFCIPVKLGEAILALGTKRVSNVVQYTKDQMLIYSEAIQGVRLAIRPDLTSTISTKTSFKFVVEADSYRSPEETIQIERYLQGEAPIVVPESKRSLKSIGGTWNSLSIGSNDIIGNDLKFEATGFSGFYVGYSNLIEGTLDWGNTTQVKLDSFIPVGANKYYLGIKGNSEAREAGIAHLFVCETKIPSEPPYNSSCKITPYSQALKPGEVVSYVKFNANILFIITSNTSPEETSFHIISIESSTSTTPKVATLSMKSLPLLTQIAFSGDSKTSTYSFGSTSSALSSPVLQQLPSQSPILVKVIIDASTTSDTSKWIKVEKFNIDEKGAKMWTNGAGANVINDDGSVTVALELGNKLGCKVMIGIAKNGKFEARESATVKDCALKICLVDRGIIAAKIGTSDLRGYVMMYSWKDLSQTPFSFNLESDYTENSANLDFMLEEYLVSKIIELYCIPELKAVQLLVELKNGKKAIATLNISNALMMNSRIHSITEVPSDTIGLNTNLITSEILTEKKIETTLKRAATTDLAGRFSFYQFTLSKPVIKVKSPVEDGETQASIKISSKTKSKTINFALSTQVNYEQPLISSSEPKLPIEIKVNEELNLEQFMKIKGDVYDIKPATPLDQNKIRFNSRRDKNANSLFMGNDGYLVQVETSGEWVLGVRNDFKKLYLTRKDGKEKKDFVNNLEYPSEQEKALIGEQELIKKATFARNTPSNMVIALVFFFDQTKKTYRAIILFSEGKEAEKMRFIPLEIGNFADNLEPSTFELNYITHGVLTMSYLTPSGTAPTTQAIYSAKDAKYIITGKNEGKFNSKVKSILFGGASNIHSFEDPKKTEGEYNHLLVYAIYNLESLGPGKENTVVSITHMITTFKTTEQSYSTIMNGNINLGGEHLPPGVVIQQISCRLKDPIITDRKSKSFNDILLCTLDTEDSNIYTLEYKLKLNKMEKEGKVDIKANSWQEAFDSITLNQIYEKPSNMIATKIETSPTFTAVMFKSVVRVEKNITLDNNAGKNCEYNLIVYKPGDRSSYPWAGFACKDFGREIGEEAPDFTLDDINGKTLYVTSRITKQAQSTKLTGLKEVSKPMTAEFSLGDTRITLLEKAFDVRTLKWVVIGDKGPSATSPSFSLSSLSTVTQNLTPSSSSSPPQNKEESNPQNEGMSGWWWFAIAAIIIIIIVISGVLFFMIQKAKDVDSPQNYAKDTTLDEEMTL